MLEFVDPGLYLVQYENNFINPLLQVGSGSNEKFIGSGRQRITGSGILISVKMKTWNFEQKLFFINLILLIIYRT